MVSARSHSVVNVVLLVVLGLLDLATTVLWLRTGHAVEANPVMAALLHAGLPVFILVKMCTLAAYVGVIRWYRRRNPEFCRAVGNFTFSAYLLIYVTSLWCVNRGFFLG
jgi:uncharacterized membrane protein